MKSNNFKKKSIHVLFTGLVSDTILTGGDQLFLDIAPRLPKDINIVIITPEFAKKHWDKIDQSNIRLILLKNNIFDLKDNSLLIFLSYMVRTWQTYWILKKEDVQYIYSCSDIAYADIWPAFFIKKKKKDIIWLARIYHILLSQKNRQGNKLINIVAYKLQRLSFWMIKKNGNMTFALNPDLHDELSNLGFNKKKLVTLGAGIDFKDINGFKKTKSYNYDIVALGRVAPVKGIYDAIKIIKQIKDHDKKVNFAWIGGGPENYTNNMRKLIAENSLEDNFHMLGFIDNSEVYNVLKSAKIFICTDHEIGWGLAVCQAMASGLPVVSYDNDVFGSVYKKGFKTAPLFDTTNFAKEVIKLIDNEEVRNKIANEAVKQAREFDHEQVINTLVKYIK